MVLRGGEGSWHRLVFDDDDDDCSELGWECGGADVIGVGFHGQWMRVVQVARYWR